jgi:hypothetical protein
MIFVASDIGGIILTQLCSAIEVSIATAYFCPDEAVFAALRALSRLTLIVSEEFTVNDPYKLEELAKTAAVWSVPVDCNGGKLHAKVFFVRHRDGSAWALVGSANMTWQGLFSNQEACLTLDSKDPGDRDSLEAIENWFAAVLTIARRPDFDQAKEIFDAQSMLRLERRPLSLQDHRAPDYWALKTTSGSGGEDHWPKFLAENVIAIGWPSIGTDPSSLSLMELEKVVAAAYPYSEKDPDGDSDHGEKDPHRVAIKIKRFVDLEIGDIVLICKGYPPKTTKPVHIHGFARVQGAFRYDRTSNWKWVFKHDAVLQVIDQYLPKEIVAEALGKESLRETIHQLDKAGVECLAKRLGVHLAV